jgi:hypothetical protein
VSPIRRLEGDSDPKKEYLLLHQRDWVLQTKIAGLPASIVEPKAADEI